MAVVIPREHLMEGQYCEFFNFTCPYAGIFGVRRDDGYPFIQSSVICVGCVMTVTSLEIMAAYDSKKEGYNG